MSKKNNKKVKYAVFRQCLAHDIVMVEAHSLSEAVAISKQPTFRSTQRLMERLEFVRYVNQDKWKGERLDGTSEES